MPFTIIRAIQQVPTYAMLRELAGQNQVQTTGNERAGTFSSRGVEGTYEFTSSRLQGRFAGHGVKGEYSFDPGQATVTITDKPFWLPEALLKQKIEDGLAQLCASLSQRQADEINGSA